MLVSFRGSWMDFGWKLYGFFEPHEFGYYLWDQFLVERIC